MSGIHIASNESDSYTPTGLFAGESDIITNSFTVLTGQTLPANSVVALNSAGKLVEWVPGASNGTEVAVGITTEAIDTSGGDQIHAVYIGGYFNTDAIQWPSGTTAAQKLNAFINTNITHRSLGYSG